MKKCMVIAALVPAMVLSLAGCSSSNARYLKGLKASNYVTPCDYEGIVVEISSADYEVSDTYVDFLVTYAVSSTAYEAEVTDRDDVQDGDIVNIDYVGTLDGEEFDGGSSEGYELTIGSGTFIDGFEEGLIGCTVGSTVDLELTFPEDYSSEDLAGQDVVFTVTINSILETIVPELTDEWVLEQGIDGIETADEFWQYYYDYLEADAEDAYDDELEELIMDYLVENSTFKKDLPEGMVERVTETITEYYQEYSDYYGYDSLDEFMQYYYDTEEGEYESYITGLAEDTVKQLLVAKAISDKEGLNPSKSEWETQLSIYAAYYGYDSIEDYKEENDAESIRENLMISNVLEFLKESVVVVEPEEEEEETEEEEAEEEEETEEGEETEEEETEEEEEAEEEETEEGEEAEEEETEEEEEAEEEEIEEEEEAEEEEIEEAEEEEEQEEETGDTEETSGEDSGDSESGDAQEEEESEEESSSEESSAEETTEEETAVD